ncbi:RNA polymerase sigma factor [Paenibacillus tarimensis]
MSQHDPFVLYALVERAREGDEEAFSELVRQHRGRMLIWADQVVRHPVKAEDIVQEALIVTLKQMNSLKEPSRFLPWLRTIVRNQALMSIRGGKHMREILIGGGDDGEDSPHENPMFDELQPNDPERNAIGIVALEEIERLFSRLGEREKAVVELHSIAGLSIPEAAERLKMKRGAVYTALSRARTKLNEARFEIEVERYISARRKRGRPANVVMDKLKYWGFASAYNTMAATMTIAIAAMGKDNVSLSDVMGATGHAFRIQVTPDIGLSSPYAYNWMQAGLDGFGRLGYSAAIYGGAGVFIQQPEMLTEAMDAIFESLEQGVPVIAWHLSNAEFGLITGFNDHERCWLVMDTSAFGKKLPYDRLGRLYPDSEWCIFIPRRNRTTYLPMSLSDTLKEAAGHIRGERGGESGLSFAGGRDAYRVWLDALEHKSLTEPLSVAYNSAVIAEARAHAERFLHRLIMPDLLKGRQAEALPSITHVYQLYRRISGAWRAISALFPLPYGADPAAPGSSERAAQLLERALSTELEAADVLEEAAYRLSLR